MTATITTDCDISTPTIDLGPKGTFKLRVQQPTYGDLSKDDGIRWSQKYRDPADGYVAATQHRVESMVIGWDELLNEKTGEPLPFSFDALYAVCRKFPTVYNQLCGIVNTAYAGYIEEPSKNSDAPPSDSGAAIHDSTSTNIQS